MSIEAPNDQFEVHETDKKIELFRRFNRALADRTRLFDARLYGGVLSAAEARLLWETARLASASLTELTAAMNADPAHICRLLNKLESDKLIRRVRNQDDKRVQVITLTAKGKRLLTSMVQKTEDHLETLLSEISPDDQAALFGAMQTIIRTLNPTPDKNLFIIRPRRLGDIGRVLHLHGLVYGLESGYGRLLESHVAHDLAKLDGPKCIKRSELWVAEANSELVGCIGILDRGKNIAQLHWLMVKQTFRGLGVGRQLVRTALNFCREHAFRMVRLQTAASLAAARHLYETEGFTLVTSEPKRMFNTRITLETWELLL